MDCAKFDQHVIDELYDELDELTHAALERHVAGCSRCAGVLAGLRATRRVGVLPLEEPPADLEDRILAAVAAAHPEAPPAGKVIRLLPWTRRLALRPQLALAAAFLLLVGASTLLLRQAAPPQASVATAPAATAAPVAVAAQPEAAPTAEGAAAEAPAMLAAARALRDREGCAAAVPRLDAVATRFAGTEAAADAMWDEAACYKQMGDAQKAQQLYAALGSTSYGERARLEIAAAAASAAPGSTATAQAQAAVRVAGPPAAAKPAEVLDSRAGAAAAGGSKAKTSAGAPSPRAVSAPAKDSYR